MKTFKIAGFFSLLFILGACDSGPKIESLELQEEEVVLGFVEKMSRASNGHFLMINEESQLIELDPNTGTLTKHFEMTDAWKDSVWTAVEKEYDYLDFVQPESDEYTNSFWMTGFWENEQHYYLAYSFDYNFNGQLDSIRAQISCGFTALFDVSEQGTKFYIFNSDEYVVKDILELSQARNPGSNVGTLDYGFCIKDKKVCAKKLKHSNFLDELALSTGLSKTGELSLNKNNAWPSEEGLLGQFKRIENKVYMSDGIQVYGLNEDFCYHLDKKNMKMIFADFYIGKDFATYMYQNPSEKSFNIVRTDLKGKNQKSLAKLSDVGSAYWLDANAFYFIQKDEKSVYLKTVELK